MILLRTNFVEDGVEWIKTQRGLLASSLHKADTRRVIPNTVSFQLPYIEESPDSDVREVQR
jgi:hypothetical protein